MSLFNELKRRNVIRVAMAYVVASWLIIQVVETILPAYGLGDAAIRLVVTLLGVAFIPTLVFSWVFEFTPDGLKREVDVASEHSITRFTGKKLDRIIMVLLAVGMGYFAFDKFILDPVEDAQIAESAHEEGRAAGQADPQHDHSIAILPFEFSSLDAAPFFGQLSGDLARLLQRSDQLRLASNDAIEALPTDMSYNDIAVRLGVRYLVNGFISMEGGTTSLSVSMFDTGANGNIWTIDSVDAYSQQSLDMIARKIMAEFTSTALSLPPMATDPSAYELYLRARQHYSTEQKPESERLYREAIALDSRFPAALAGLCELLVDRYQVTKSSQDFEGAERHCFRAWTIDSQSLEVQQSLGLLYKVSGQNEKAREAFTAALAINPGSLETQVSLIGTYITDKPALAEEQLKKIIRQHPGSPEAYQSLGYLYFKQGRNEEAVEPFRWASRLRPEDEGTKVGLTSVLMHAGLFDEAKPLLLNLIASSETKYGNVETNLATLLYFQKDYAGAAKLYQDAIERQPEKSMHYRNMGDAIWQLKGKEAAEKFFKNAIIKGNRQLEINPNDFWVISDLIVSYGSIGDTDKFQSLKITLLGMVESDPQPHYDIAVAASRLGDLETARFHAEKAQELGYPLAFLRADPDIAISNASFLIDQ